MRVLGVLAEVKIDDGSNYLKTVKKLNSLLMVHLIQEFNLLVGD